MLPASSAPLAGLFLVLAVLPLTFSTPAGHWARPGHPAKNCAGQERPVELFVESADRVRFLGESLSLSELPARVRQVMRPRAMRALFVKALPDTAYGDVARAIGSIAPEVEHAVLLTPRLEQAGGGCYAVGLTPFQDQSLAPEAPHVQPVPRWKPW